MKAQTQIHYEVRIKDSLGVGGRFYNKQDALDHCKHLMDTQPIESRTNGHGEVFDYFVVKITTTIQPEGEDDSPSTPLSDFAIHELMTSIKDSWHHFRTDDIKDSLKSVAGRVFFNIKKYCNPDLDVNAMVEMTWLTQDHMGTGLWAETEEDLAEFNEYVENWKYPRKDNNER